VSDAYEAVALVEIGVIARGYVALDAIAKRAPVNVRFARAVTPGKFLILFGGEVASVEESLEAAKEVAGSDLIDELLLPYAHQALLPAMEGAMAPEPGDAVGVVETDTVASTLRAGDVALKATEVAVMKMHLAVGIGGKGYFTLAGDLASVEASLEAVRREIEAERLVGVELIPHPSDEVRGHFR
jgi:microcompartment protein CcmL/EutN